MNVKGGAPYPQQSPPPYAPPGAQGPAPAGYGPPPPPMGFSPPPTPQPVNTITVIQVPSATRLGPVSGCITCPSCHAVVSTRVEHEASSRTHMFAFLLCIFGFWPCCLIPYCMDSCQSSNHYCPACGAFVGAYRN